MVAALERTAPAREVHFRLRKGLDIPIDGVPRQEIEPGPAPTTVGLIGADYVGLRARLLVGEGDRVRLGDPLFVDRRDPRIVFTSPGAGQITAIAMGERRSLASVAVTLEGVEEVTFPTRPPATLASLSRETVIETLLQSGQWTALRRRPFGHVPLPDSLPQAILVTAIDTDPLAPRPEAVVAENPEAFDHGLTVLGRMSDGPVVLCTAPGAEITSAQACVTRAIFAGPHPAGLPGTHIHFLSPVGIGREVWHVGYQDVIAIGRLFTTGRLWTERVVSLAGPAVRRPRLLRTRLGADLTELVGGELAEGPTRTVSGSLLSGRRMAASARFLGRYHAQISVLGEAAPRQAFDGWFSAAGLSRIFARGPLTSGMTRNGPGATMLPLGDFERVMPLDILPTALLRALAVGDIERAMDLGCLELVEEDLALCTYLCPGRLDYGPLLRRTLTQIEKEL